MPPLTTNHLPLLFWAVGPIRPSLVRGLRPRNAPGPTTCLADLVSTFGTGACPKGVRHTTFLQPRQFPVGAGLVPALARLTDGLHHEARPGACTASRQKTLSNFRHRWHGFLARLSPPQIWDAPRSHGQGVRVSLGEYFRDIVSFPTGSSSYGGYTGSGLFPSA